MCKRPELALPAGSLQCAMYAFQGGADAVYLGLKSFSARKNAVNFSFEDLRKLKALCMKSDKKFYITLNTLVNDSQIPDVIPLLKQLSYIEPDGVIIQDLGIADIIRKDFPNLPLHASTQLAVHTASGVRVLSKLGFSRAVLSRELSFKEISDIRKECPDVELKVFIHGAMCYGFSGLCMASEKLTGRSANCGECAQICRTWFTDTENKTDSWCFSMKDLSLGEKIRHYAEIGIDSLKVEGRMKGSEYVYSVARYYSAILDGVCGTELENLKKNMLTTFSRQTSEGFFEQAEHGSCNCNPMVCKDYPTHIGLKVGTVKKILNGKALVSFDEPVALRDGLLVISNGRSAGFALSKIENGKSFVSAGETTVINFPSENFSKPPLTGTDVYCTSRHNGNLPLLNENLPLYKKPVDVEISVYDDRMKINNFEFLLQIQEARTAGDIGKVLTDIFSASDKCLFSLGKMKFNNESSFKNPFIPLSVLKEIRRKFYSDLDDEFEDTIPSVSESGEIPVAISLPDNAFVLEPLMFCSDEEFYRDIPEKNADVVLNNIAQVEFAQNHPGNRYYAGTFLYAKNSYACSLLKNIIPDFKGISEQTSKNIPLFISRVCYRHNALNLPCTGCNRNNTYRISQNGKTYNVVCKNCITKVFEN